MMLVALLALLGAVSVPEAIPLSGATSVQSRDGLDAVDYIYVPAPAPQPSVLLAQANEQDLAVQKQAFLSRLRKFEDDIEPALESISLSVWKPDIARKISEAKDGALREFGLQRFSSAMLLVERMETDAAAVLQDARQNFSRFLQAAEDAVVAQDFVLAEKWGQLAYQISPESSEWLELRSRLDRAPEILQAKEEAARAYARGDALAERAALKKLVELDPSRDDVAARAQIILQDLGNEAFGKTMVKGFRAASEGDLTNAKGALQKAKLLQPNRKELPILESRVTALANAEAISVFLARAAARVEQDDWQGAEAAFRQALALEPAHLQALKGADFATRILRANGQIDNLLKRPERLTTKAIWSQAQNLVEDLRVLATISPKLSSKIDRLEKVLKLADMPVEVLVRSDGKTNVRVRGVGEIGTTRKKAISLPPGSYVLEGRRTGYRTKLVEFEIPFGGKKFEVEVVCDERISN